MGSGALEAHGIRRAQDIDLAVIPDFFEELLHNGWEVCLCEKHKNSIEKTLINPLWPEEAEIRLDLAVGEYKASAEKLIQEADIIDGLPFAKLEEILKWKKEARREKDFRDIKLIEIYLSEKTV